MATSQGKLISGKIGDKIYYVRNGKQCVRQMPESVGNPNSEAQQAHRRLIVEVARLSSDLKVAYKFGLHKYARRAKLTVDAAFRKLNYGRRKKGRFNYPRIMVSKGPVTTASITSVEVDEQRVLRLTFDGCAMEQNNQEMFHLFVYCPDLRDCRPVRPVPCTEGIVTAQLPSEWTGYDLHLYAYFIDKDNRVSNTMYVALPAEQSNPS